MNFIDFFFLYVICRAIIMTLKISHIFPFSGKKKRENEKKNEKIRNIYIGVHSRGAVPILYYACVCTGKHVNYYWKRPRKACRKGGEQ